VTATPQTDPHDDAPLVVTSDQQGPHIGLAKIVQHHLQHPWQKPCPPHTRAAFDQLLDRCDSDPRPLILDSFCGTGMSTALLAARHPDALVVGVDQSAHRLAKHQPTALNNYLLLRAEAEPFWYCLAAAGLTLVSHFMLYPNPWPKASQLKRRVHGHGAFPVLARLGGTLEMRTNWGIFAEEFTQAAQLIGLAGSAKAFTPDTPITLFERKYRQRGHTLWRFEGKCSN
jgi:tRNA G46 methylase TrmB